MNTTAVEQSVDLTGRSRGVAKRLHCDGAPETVAEVNGYSTYQVIYADHIIAEPYAKANQKPGETTPTKKLHGIHGSQPAVVIPTRPAREAFRHMETSGLPYFTQVKIIQVTVAIAGAMVVVAKMEA